MSNIQRLLALHKIEQFNSHTCSAIRANDLSTPLNKIVNNLQPNEHAKMSMFGAKQPVLAKCICSAATTRNETRNRRFIRTWIMAKM